MGMSISRETFGGADQETKLLLIYDLLYEQNKLLSVHSANQRETCNLRCSTCNTRFIRLEQRRLVHSGLAAIGGFFGGMVAVIIKMKFFDGQ